MTFLRRLPLVLALAVALLWAGHAAAAVQAPAVTVSPVRGSQFQSFAAAGTNFAPGAELETWWRSPDDQWFTTFVDDRPAITKVEQDGTFKVVVVPAIDFAGARAGTWTLYVCVSGGEECWTAEFTVMA